MYIGWRSVIGAFLIQLCLGNLYIWSFLTLYVTSYLRRYDDTLDYYDTITVYATSLGVQGLMMIFGGYLEHFIGSTKAVVAIGCLLVLTSCLIASLSKSLLNYIMFYGGLFGAGFGIAYSSSIVLCVRLNPERKSLVTGCIVAGIGLGAFLFGYVASWIINPEAAPVGSSGYYDPDSVQVRRVPLLFCYLGFIYACVMGIGLCLMEDPSVDEDADYKEVGSMEMVTITDKEASTLSTYHAADQTEQSNGSGDLNPNSIGILGELTPSQVIRSNYMWHLSSCYVMTTVGGMYLSGQIAFYGTSYFASTKFLTSIVVASNLFNGFGRPVWGVLADRYGPLNVIRVMSAVYSLIIYTYNHVSSFQNEILYAIWTFAIFFCIGGNFCLYMPISIHLSGKKHAVGNYGLIFLGLSVFEFLNIVILAKIKISFEDACTCMGFLCFLGCLNINFLAIRLQNYEDRKM